MGEQEEETLKLLGLSNIQARVYLALIKSGISSAKNLSKITNVARPDIYRIMANFQNIGIAQRTITNPIMFEATQVDQALNGLAEYKLKETEDLQKKTQSLIEILAKTHPTKNGLPPQEPEIYVLPASKIAVQKRKELILNSKQTIDIINSWKRYKYYLGFNDLTKRMVRKGVKFRIIVEIPTKMRILKEQQEALEILRENSSTLKYIKHVPSVIMSIYDNKQVLLSMSEKAGPYDTPLLWSNNPSILSMAKVYFENLWQSVEEKV